MSNQITQDRPYFDRLTQKCRLFNFVFTFATPYMISGTGTRGWGTFLFYAIFDLIMATWVFLFVHETKNKSLEQVNAEFDHDEAALEQRKLGIESEQVDAVELK